jgi:hypothetical protein
MGNGARMLSAVTNISNAFQLLLHAQSGALAAPIEIVQGPVIFAMSQQRRWRTR